MTHARSRSLLLLLAAAGTLAAADWSDTFLGYRTSSQFREPGIAKTLSKNIFQLGHASGWSHGSNFFNVDFLASDKDDPAHNGTTGAQEIYAVYRTNLSLSKVMGANLGFGPVRDLSLTAGCDFSNKDNTFASKKRMWVAGLTFHIAVPKGFWDVSLLTSKEKNHNGIVGRSVDFDQAMQVTTAWGIPIQAGPVGLEFKGYANHVAAKGRDGFGAETKAETLANLALLVDLGTVVGAKAGRVSAGVGFEYWNNKFGNANCDLPEPATNQRVTAPMLMVQVHF